MLTVKETRFPIISAQATNDGVVRLEAQEYDEVIIHPDYPDQKVRVGNDISPSAKEQIIQFLSRHLGNFAWRTEDMQGISADVAEHKLNIDPAFRPVRQKARRFGEDKVKGIQDEVQKLLKSKFIREVDYPSWLANVVMVRKSSGKWRMCVDYTDLNKACPKDWYPLPRIDALVDATSGYEFLSFMDAFSGYHQIGMWPLDQIHTSFRAAEGIYCYNVMPFGLKNAGATYQRMMNKILQDQIGRNVETYVDDMVVKTKRGSSHLIDLEETFTTLSKFGLMLNPSKCVFGVRSGKFLGFMMSERGIEANPLKIEAILALNEPRCVKDVQRLNGCIAALGRFISKSAERCMPFFKVLKKSSKAFLWDEECAKAWEELKVYLAKLPLLSPPNPGEVLYLYLSVSQQAIASVLVRVSENKQMPVYFVSRVLRDAEVRYSLIEKLAYALVISSRKLRAYFESHAVIVYTNHPLRQVFHKLDQSGRMLRWSIELCGYDLKFAPRTAVKAQALSDFLAELSFTEASPLEEAASSPVNIGTWTMTVDGAVNSQGVGVGIVIRSPSGKFEERRSIRLGYPLSNNQAEYEALILGLQWALEVGVEAIEVFSDSQVVVGQVNHEYSVNSDNLKGYAEKVSRLVAQFQYFSLEKIDRSLNEDADRLAKIASGESYNDLGIPVENLTSPEYILQLQQSADNPLTWIDELKDFITSDSLPEDRNKARQIRKRAARYTVINDVLYRRSFSRPLLRCIPPELTRSVLEELHEGICGGHPGSRTLAEKVLNQGFYWITLRRDAEDFVKHCKVCQDFGRIPRLPSAPQIPVLAAWPFDMWGIDLMGKFPKSRGCEYLIVAVDYFSKWIEAKSLAAPTEENALNFLHDFVFCRYGVPRAVVTDHGTQFSKRFTAECTRLGIKHWKSSVAHPQGNGQAEAANKIVLSALKKNLQGKSNKWVDELPATLWAVRTSARGPTGETAYALVFGSEAVSPAELALPSYRISTYDVEANKRQRCLDLDLLEERRIAARLRMENFKLKTKSTHDKGLVRRPLGIGDWVLRKIEGTARHIKSNKLSPNWEGPYLIKSEVRPGTFYLMDQEGKMLPNPWHANHLKKYFV